MAARKRASSDSTAKSTSATETHNPKSQDAATTKNVPSSSAAPPVVSPAKAGQILKVSFIFFIPYSYLIFYHYGTSIEAELKRSILINALLSFTGFFLTLVLIPVASRYVLRRNMFGYDINKKGTPQGSVKVPESLGIVVGVIFLVLAILFQYFNFTSDSNITRLIHTVAKHFHPSAHDFGKNDQTQAGSYFSIPFFDG